MTQYRAKNWSQYNRSLVNRGSLTLWVSDDALESWKAGASGERGHPQVYSDKAILCAMSLKAVFRLPYRQTEGFLKSIFELMGVELPVPSYSRICRRAKKLELPKGLAAGCRPLCLVIDSTGFKVYGEGEWHTKVHGKSKRRRWKKFHVAVCTKTQKIISCKPTELEEADCTALPELIEKAPLTVQEVAADGAYDTHGVHQILHKRKITPKIPPREGAVVDAQRRPCMQPRDDAIQIIQGLGGDSIARKLWKKLTGYHIRSLAETAMSRLKRTFGSGLFSRLKESQDTELQLKVFILNTLTSLGMPESYPV